MFFSLATGIANISSLYLLCFMVKYFVFTQGSGRWVAIEGVQQYKNC